MCAGSINSTTLVAVTTRGNSGGTCHISCLQKAQRGAEIFFLIPSNAKILPQTKLNQEFLNQCQLITKVCRAANTNNNNDKQIESYFLVKTTKQQPTRTNKRRKTSKTGLYAEASVIEQFYLIKGSDLFAAQIEFYRNWCCTVFMEFSASSNFGFVQKTINKGTQKVAVKEITQKYNDCFVSKVVINKILTKSCDARTGSMVLQR